VDLFLRQLLMAAYRVFDLLLMGSVSISVSLLGSSFIARLVSQATGDWLLSLSWIVIVVGLLTSVTLLMFMFIMVIVKSRL
jgi:hypothetical protein